MVAQTATNRLGATTVQRLANLQREIAGTAPLNMSSAATTTVTIVHTTATGAVTIDVATT